MSLQLLKIKIFDPLSKSVNCLYALFAKRKGLSPEGLFMLSSNLILD